MRLWKPGPENNRLTWFISSNEFVVLIVEVVVFLNVINHTSEVNLRVINKKAKPKKITVNISLE